MQKVREISRGGVQEVMAFKTEAYKSHRKFRLVMCWDRWDPLLPSRCVVCWEDITP